MYVCEFSHFDGKEMLFSKVSEGCSAGQEAMLRRLGADLAEEEDEITVMH